MKHFRNLALRKALHNDEQKRNCFIGIGHISNMVTYLGIASAVIGMMLLTDIELIGDYKIISDIRSAMVCLIIAGVCDLFDGVFARCFERDARTKAFGVQLDSLADTVSFIAFPICILLKLTNTVLSGIVCVFYALAGISRLAWFNITKEENMTHYDGLPVTYAAMLIPGFYIGYLAFLPSSAWLWFFMPLLYAALAFAFILNIKIRKPRGIWYGILSLMAIAWIALLFFI